MIMNRSMFGGVIGDARERARGSLSVIIVWLCIGLFVGVSLLDVLHILRRESAVSFLGLSYAGVVRQLRLFQFLTAPLMHGGVTHLLFNMLTLWMLGPEVERSLGRRHYACFSLVCALASMAGSLLANWGTGVVTVGFSGVIFGILVAQAAFYPDSRILMFFFFPIKMKFAVVILSAVELYLTVAPEGGTVAHAAHLFGTLAGWGYLRVWRRLRNRQAATAGAVKRVAAGRAPGHPLRRRPEIPKEL